MYNAAENTQVGFSRSIGCTDQVYRFKPGKTVDEICPEEPVPGIDSG
jgi:hypothetical protein